MSDRTDEATRDPSAPEPEPEPDRNCRRVRDAARRRREPTLVPIISPTGSTASSRAISDPVPDVTSQASTRPRHPSTCRPTSTWRRWSNVTSTRRAGGVGDGAGRRSGGSSAGRPTWATSDWPTTRIVQVVFTVFSLAVTTAIMMNVVHLNPLSSTRDLVFDDTTPTGGDFGAHVWGPAFLRDHLLPSWRLNGWSMDWYAGMPTYRFYMVVPALLVVALDTVLAVRRRPEGRLRARADHAPGALLGIRPARPVPLPDARAVRVRRSGVRSRRELQHLRRQPQIDDGGRVLVLDRAVARRSSAWACCRRVCAPASTASGRRSCSPRRAVRTASC